MKTMLIAAAAVLSLGGGTAFADGGDSEGGVVPNNVAVNQYSVPPANTAVAVPPPATYRNGS
jgi:hypothetical protein